jgi:hypothetical protein
MTVDPRKTGWKDRLQGPATEPAAELPGHRQRPGPETGQRPGPETSRS